MPEKKPSASYKRGESEKGCPRALQVLQFFKITPGLDFQQSPKNMKFFSQHFLSLLIQANHNHNSKNDHEHDQSKKEDFDY